LCWDAAITGNLSGDFCFQGYLRYETN